MVTTDRSTAPLTAEGLLREARRGLKRLSPIEARNGVANGAALIDIRSEVQRRRDGAIPMAHCIPRNVLEWRLDPESEYRNVALARRDQQLIVLCDEGYQSSLAAATLSRFGLRVTDVIGGFQAWRAARLSVDHHSE